MISASTAQSKEAQDIWLSEYHQRDLMPTSFSLKMVQLAIKAVASRLQQMVLEQNAHNHQMHTLHSVIVLFAPSVTRADFRAW